MTCICHEVIQLKIAPTSRITFFWKDFFVLSDSNKNDMAIFIRQKLYTHKKEYKKEAVSSCEEDNIILILQMKKVRIKGFSDLFNVRE